MSLVEKIRDLGETSKNAVRYKLGLFHDMQAVYFLQDRELIGEYCKVNNLPLRKLGFRRRKIKLTEEQYDEFKRKVFSASVSSLASEGIVPAAYT